MTRRSLRGLGISRNQRQRGAAPMNRSRPWKRLLWGIRFTSSLNATPVLLGGAWLRVTQSDVPLRALLYDRRQDARQAAQQLTEQHRHIPGWRFRAVRVRETVEEFV